MPADYTKIDGSSYVFVEVSAEAPAPVRFDDCLSMLVEFPFAVTEYATVATSIQEMLTAGGKVVGATG